MITCLDDYIGLRGTCSDVTPVSGMYINDMAGIDLKGLAMLSNEEQQSFQGVWDEIYRRSVSELEADVLIGMQKYFKTKILLENNRTGYYRTDSNGYELEALSAYYKGIAIELFGSKNMQVFINSVELYTNAQVSSFIYVYDYNANKIVDSIAFTSVANAFNQIQINKSYNVFGTRKKLFICYNGNLTSSYKTNYTPYYEGSASYSIIRGASVSTSSQVIESNMTFDANSGGLILDFNVNCAIDNFICSNRDLFKMPLYFKLGENTMLERLTTQRINEYSLFNEEQVKELKAYYNSQYVKTLDSVLNNLEPEGDDICFKCNKSRTYKYQMP